MLSFDERGRGPALLFIHAYPLDHSMWDAQMAFFSKRFRVVAPDIIGFGGSQPPRPWTIPDMVQELVSLLDQLKIERCTLVGLSIGGGWAIAGTSFYKLEKDWVALPTGPWKKASDGFRREDRACVVERDASRMHHFDGKAWHSSASPVTGPRSLWGGSESLWIAGDSGVSVWRDGAFQKTSAPAQAVQVLGRSESDVWVCSAQGVFRSR